MFFVAKVFGSGQANGSARVRAMTRIIDSKGDDDG